MSVKNTQPVLLQRVVEAGGQEVWIDIWSTSGKETIARADDTFRHIDSNFWKWGLDVPGRPTPSVKGALYDLVAPATLRQAFTWFGRPFRGISPTQHQIIECVKRNQDLLFGDEVYGAFFLCRHGYEFGNFFPVYVSRELRATIYPSISPLGTSADGRVWRIEHPRRVVVLE